MSLPPFGNGWAVGDARSRRKLAEELLRKGTETSPIKHWMQGVERLSSALVGGIMAREEERQQAKAWVEYANALLATRGGGATSAVSGAGQDPATASAPLAPGLPQAGPMVPPHVQSYSDAIHGDIAAQEAGYPANYTTPAADPVQPSPAGLSELGQYRQAIRNIESGGGNYRAIGKPTRTGARAYGADQVMDYNIGPWTEAALGRRLTPQEFLDDPNAQNAVFDHRFGQYVRQYGSPEEAASRWFTGRSIAEGANRRDINGMSGANYVAQFSRHLRNMGPPAPSGGPLAPWQTPQPTMPDWSNVPLPDGSMPPRSEPPPPRPPSIGDSAIGATSQLSPVEGAVPGAIAAPPVPTAEEDTRYTPFGPRATAQPPAEGPPPAASTSRSPFGLIGRALQSQTPSAPTADGASAPAQSRISPQVMNVLRNPYVSDQMKLLLLQSLTGQRTRMPRGRSGRLRARNQLTGQEIAFDGQQWGPVA